MITKNVQTLGVVMMGTGVLFGIIYVFEPFRSILTYFLELPVPLQIGLGLFVGGFFVILLSLLSERWSDRDADASLKDDYIKTPKL